MNGTFRSLRHFNYRMWAGGAIVSNVGTWMQRTAQDWIVLTHLTDGNATALGVVVALQFCPQVLLLPVTGFVVDRFDRHRILFVTQFTLGMLALGLGLLTVTGYVELWHVCVFAFLLGCAAAFDAPARQTFVSDLVDERDLSNAVALNSTSFNAGRLIGPAVAGVLIASVGCAWVFLINAASYVAVLGSLSALRRDELLPRDRTLLSRGSLVEGFRYVWERPDIRALLSMLFLFGAFGLLFPVYISTMAVSVFNVGSDQYGLLTSLMAIGSVTGALLSARREKPQIGLLFLSALVFGLGFVLAAASPSYWFFSLVLILIGVAAQTFMTTMNSLVQLSTQPAMRGRVMAIYIAVAMGGAPLGAPIVGWVADRFGPRWALGVGATAAFAAILIGACSLAKHGQLHVRDIDGHWRLRIDLRKQSGLADVKVEAVALEPQESHGLEELKGDVRKQI